MAFNKNLQKLRIKRGLSQQDLANAIGVTRSSVANYESGNRRPSFENLIKLADYFNVTCDELIREEKINGKKIRPKRSC